MSVRTRRWSRIGLSTAAVAGITMVATPAQAATTTGVAKVVYGTQVVYTAGAGRVNRVTLTQSGNTLTIDDRVRIRPGEGCRRVGRDVTRVRCTTTLPLKSVRVRLGDRDDAVTNRTAVRLSAYGGAGRDRIELGRVGGRADGGSGADRLYGGAAADTLVGGTGNDRMYGGGARDRLFGGPGNDRLHGGPGNDELNGGRGDDAMWGDNGHDRFEETRYRSGSGAHAGVGADRMFGGEGVDQVAYFGWTTAVTADPDGVSGDDGGRGEGDTIARDVEDLYGGEGNDVLRGNGQANLLYGGPGDDRLSGGGGSDELYGLTGKDVLRGGAGNDVLQAGVHSDRSYGDGGDDVIMEGGRGTNLLDGGPNATSRGDVCRLTDSRGTRVDCERP